MGHPDLTVSNLIAVGHGRSAMAGRIYKVHDKHTSNSGFDRTFMLCSGYILYAAVQRVGNGEPNIVY